MKKNLFSARVFCPVNTRKLTKLRYNDNNFHVDSRIFSGQQSELETAIFSYDEAYSFTK